MQNPDKVWGT